MDRQSYTPEAPYSRGEETEGQATKAEASPATEDQAAKDDEWYQDLMFNAWVKEQMDYMDSEQAKSAFQRWCDGLGGPDAD